MKTNKQIEEKLEKTIIEKYSNNLIPHKGNKKGLISFLDTSLREIIGKTDGMDVGKCSHNAIIKREMKSDKKNLEHYCRCCGIYLNYDGVGRCNDFLIFRNKKCEGPICFTCIKENPDIWYIKYKEALEVFKGLKI